MVAVPRTLKPHPPAERHDDRALAGRRSDGGDVGLGRGAGVKLLGADDRVVLEIGIAGGGVEGQALPSLQARADIIVDPVGVRNARAPADRGVGVGSIWNPARTVSFFPTAWSAPKATLHVLR